MLKYNDKMLQRAEKRRTASSSAFVSFDNANDNVLAIEHSLQKQLLAAPPVFPVESLAETLHEVTTFQVDTRVRRCAAKAWNNELTARLSMGDVLALEAKYYYKCLLAPYFRVLWK